MKKSVLSIVILLALTSTVRASEGYSISKFPVKYEINGQFNEAIQQSGKSPEILETYNINGHAYVPARLLVEAMGGAVSYDANTETIRIKNFNPSQKFAVLSQTKEEGPFRLSIQSTKAEYNKNDMIEVWGNLTYLDDNEIKIYHVSPLLTYHIKDSSGLDVKVLNELAEKDKILSKGNEVFSPFPLNLIPLYNLRKDNKKVDNIYDFISTEEAQTLPSGEYTIGIIASFFTADKHDDPHTVSRNIHPIDISTELKIVVK